MGELIIIEKWAENLEEVTVNRWLKQEGDRVEAGDSLCEIITDKATFEYEVETPGILHAIYAPAKSTVPVGYVIAFIGEQCEEPPEGIEEQNSAQLAEHRRLSELELDLAMDLLPQVGAPRAGPSRVGATPAARRLAREHGLTIAEIARALDIEGAVREEDVQRYLDMEGEQ
jgi:pyruvate dehydrogenase E2 component (dihydrolipoamide acetyltransferase)